MGSSLDQQCAALGSIQPPKCKHKESRARYKLLLLRLPDLPFKDV